MQEDEHEMNDKRERGWYWMMRKGGEDTKLCDS